MTGRRAKTKDRDLSPKTKARRPKTINGNHRRARFVALPPKAGVYPTDCGSYLRGEKLSLNFNARHLARYRGFPGGSVSLLQIERRTPFSDPGQLLRSSARTAGRTTA